MRNVLLATRKESITFEEHALEDEVTHWMHVDWMVAMTSRDTCHRLLQQRHQSARILQGGITSLLT